MVISSQRYLDSETVESKRAAGDYAVIVSPELEIDGERYVVVLDGHHSLEAARMDGVEPEFETATAEHIDYIDLASSDPEMFLERAYNDSDYYDVETGLSVF